MFLVVENKCDVKYRGKVEEERGGGMMRDCQKKLFMFQREGPTRKKLKADYVMEEENMKHNKKRIMNEGTRKRKWRVWRGIGWQKAAGDSVPVWMTLQSSHMPDRCHVW